jgi:hypothetical protein
MLEVYLIEFGLHFFELSFKLLYSFLAFFLDFPETNDFPLGFLCLQLYLVHLRNQSATLFLVHLLELFCFLKLQLQVLFFVLQPGYLRLEDIYLELILSQIFHELLQFVLGHVELVLGTSEFSL